MESSASWLARLLVTGLLLLLSPTAQPRESPDDPDAKCLKCHSRNLKKTLEDGAVLSLRVDGEAFEDSVHRVIGCTGCHRDVARSRHPSREPIASRRAYSLRRNETCGQCHAGRNQAYENSIHARLVAAGESKAPLCSDCHDSHAVRAHAFDEPTNGEPCTKCHEETYDAYVESVHRQTEDGSGAPRDSGSPAPACFDCHDAHETRAVAVVDYLRETCFGCHEGARAAHGEWLPNATVHLRAVACAVCHAPTADRRIDLQLYDRDEERPFEMPAADTALASLFHRVDPGGDTLSPAELSTLMQQVNRQAGASRVVTLRGRLEVASGVDAHRLVPRGQAIRNCETCHEGGSSAFRNVTVSVIRSDGRQLSIPADSDVLTSAVSIGSVGDFYAPGGTRIRFLDWLVIITVLAGIAIPLAHIAFGKYLRRSGSRSNRP